MTEDLDLGQRCARMPFDPEAELSVLAEIAAPLHNNMNIVTCGMFYDQRNARIVSYLRGESSDLRHCDRVYLADAAQFAFPLTAALLGRFLDSAARRARLHELEVERVQLLGPTA